MIVMGMVAVDHAVAVAEYRVANSPGPGRKVPSLGRLLLSYLTDRNETYDPQFLHGLTSAVEVVSSRSQSMYMGSAMFQGGLRIDLIQLYVLELLALH